jgi:hypothetical protein
VLLVAAAALAPVLVVIDLAAVSTWCDHLRNKINNIMTECKSVEDLNVVYHRTNPLLTCL